MDTQDMLCTHGMPAYQSVDAGYLEHGLARDARQPFQQLWAGGTILNSVIVFVRVPAPHPALVHVLHLCAAACDRQNASDSICVGCDTYRLRKLTKGTHHMAHGGNEPTLSWSCRILTLRHAMA
eukprot:365456-Chlamydomonas_euryale.AAC.3